MLSFKNFSLHHALFAVLISLSAHCTSAASLQELDYSLTPIPNWVVPIEAGSRPDDDDVVGGQSFLLIDRQYHDDGKRVAQHRHTVNHILGQAGLSENSSLAISFNPTYQRLELHTVNVLRKGEESDRLAQARISVARTENSTHRDLLHGEVTAIVVLHDIRINDQVEVRYTLYGRNPVFDSRHFSQWRVRWNKQVERSVLRVTVPESMKLTETKRPEARFSERLSGGLRSLEWFWDRVAPSVAEARTTAWHPQPDMLELSAYQSWLDVAKWGTTLFEGHSADGEAYRALSQSIQLMSNNNGLDSAIAMAIDHVQKNIRYYGVELGENSHKPHAPDEVLRNGYGDCKDKALLLVSLLTDLGVKAWPLLVSSRVKNGIVDLLPSPGAFDHVVVLVEHSGEQYWVDATDTSQMGFLGYRGQPRYGAGVVLGKPGVSLIESNYSINDQPTSKSTHDKFYLSSMGGPVDFVTTTTYRGLAANWLRRRLDQSGKRALQNNLIDYYRDLYGDDLQYLEPIQIVEDEQYNVMTSTERYRLHALWNVDHRRKVAEFKTYALTVRALMSELPKIGKSRKAPLPINGPVKVAHRIQFFPNIASPERELEAHSFGMSGFKYQSSEYVLGDSMVFDTELEITTSELAANQTGEYNKFRDRVLINSRSGRHIRLIDEKTFKLGSTTSTLLKDLSKLF